jgi:hypothetical protein
MQTAWAPWIRDLVETLQTHLAEVNHEGEPKPLHPKPLACGRLLHATIYWKNGEATAHRAFSPQTHQVTASWPARPLPHHVSTPQAYQSTTPPGLHHTGPLILCPTGPLSHCSSWPLPWDPQGCCPSAHQPAAPPVHHLQAHQSTTHPQSHQRTAHPLPATGGLQHYQSPAPNLPTRHRKTGLEAKGVTSKQLRLQFYCSWTIQGQKWYQVDWWEDEKRWKPFSPPKS